MGVLRWATRDHMVSDEGPGWGNPPPEPCGMLGKARDQMPELRDASRPATE